MNTYTCIYKGMTKTVEAPNRAEAYRQGLDYFQPPRRKRHLVKVVLVLQDAIPVDPNVNQA